MRGGRGDRSYRGRRKGCLWGKEEMLITEERKTERKHAGRQTESFIEGSQKSRLSQRKKRRNSGAGKI